MVVAHFEWWPLHATKSYMVDVEDMWLTKDLTATTVH